MCPDHMCTDYGRDMASPSRLPFTQDEAAQELLATNSAALLVGIVLYQQIPVEKAFAGPAVLQERLGRPIDCRDIAAMEPGDLEEVFRERPAIHRFPANMAKRTQAVCEHVTSLHDGDPAGLWAGAATADDVIANLKDIPGFGDYKARVYFGVLSKWFDVRPEGWEDLVPNWPTITDVDTLDDLAELKIRKKAWKEAGNG